MASLRDSDLLASIFDDPTERHNSDSHLGWPFHEGKPDSWAYRWTFTVLQVVD